ncbi:MAG: hypothetical protein KDJ68_02305 [Rhodobiaceae bacterium]|nr:hypothetical protein [Rhodobiaceae bacterium]
MADQLAAFVDHGNLTIVKDFTGIGPHTATTGAAETEAVSVRRMAHSAKML